MDSAERSRKRAQRWSKRKAVVYQLAVCFVVGALAPLVATRGPSIDGIGASFLPFGSVQRVAPPSPPAAPDIGLLLIVTVTRPDEDGMLQEAALTRLGHTLRLVPPPLVWIVVGAENRSASTVQVLRSTGVMFRHLTYAVGENNATNITTAVNNDINNSTMEASATTATNNGTTNNTVEASATTTVNNATNNSTVEASTTNTTTIAEKNGTNNTIVKNNATNNNTVEASATSTTTATEKNGTNNTIIKNNTTNNNTVEARATNTTATAEKNGTNNTIVENNATNTTTGNAGDEADLQRNVALSHIERHRLAGVVHFTASSAIYDLRFFEELRQTRGVAAWPTATVSSADQRVTLQGPTCNSSKITGWYSKDSDTNETHGEHVAAAQDTGAVHNISSSPPAIEISGLGFRSSVLWESEWFINSNSSSGGSSQDFIQLVRQMAVSDEDEQKGIPSDCSESRIMMWHLDMAKHTPEVEEQETPQEQSLLEEDEEDYMA